MKKIHELEFLKRRSGKEDEWLNHSQRIRQRYMQNITAYNQIFELGRVLLQRVCQFQIGSCILGHIWPKGASQYQSTLKEKRH
jgi:hypothetical protein